MTKYRFGKVPLDETKLLELLELLELLGFLGIGAFRAFEAFEVFECSLALRAFANVYRSFSRLASTVVFIPSGALRKVCFVVLG